LAVFVAATLVLGHGTAGRDVSCDPRSHLERAKACYAAVDLECAEREAAAARSCVETETPKELRVGILAMSAQIYFAKRDEARALVFLTQLLELEPSFRPPKGSWPEEWVQELERLRLGAPDREPPVLRAMFPDEVSAHRPLLVRIVAEDRSGVGGVFVHVGEDRGISLVTRDGRTWEGEIPAEWVEGPVLRLWAEATDLEGNGPGLLGSKEQPIEVRVVPEARPKGTSIVKTWWFWTGVTLIVGLGVFGAYELARMGKSEGRTGDAEVRLSWPTPYGF